MTGAFIAAFSKAIGMVLNKIALSYQKVGHRQFIIILFLLLFLLCLPLYPFLGRVSPLAFSLPYLIILFAVAISASIYNVLYYHGIEKEKLVQAELIIMLTPLSTIILASIFLETERNLSVFICGIISSLALFFSHFQHHHLKFNFYEKELLLYLFIYPIESILIKHLLYLYSPLALYTFRTFLVFFILCLWYLMIGPMLKLEPKINFSKWDLKNYSLCTLIAILGLIDMVLVYYAYQQIGIVFTTIVLTLAPILTYIFASVILKERIKKRIILAASVILICIVYAHFSLR